MEAKSHSNLKTVRNPRQLFEHSAFGKKFCGSFSNFFLILSLVENYYTSQKFHETLLKFLRNFQYNATPCTPPKKNISKRKTYKLHMIHWAVMNQAKNPSRNHGGEIHRNHKKIIKRLYLETQYFWGKYPINSYPIKQYLIKHSLDTHDNWIGWEPPQGQFGGN